MSESRFDRIDGKLDEINSKLSTIDVTLGKQEQEIAYHIKRTNLLEEKLEPVEDHVKAVNTVLKLIGFVAILTTIFSNLYKIKEWLHFFF